MQIAAGWEVADNGGKRKQLGCENGLGGIDLRQRQITKVGGSAEVVRKSFFHRLGNDFRTNKGVYLMALPILVHYIIFQYVPLPGLAIAFQNYNLFKGIGGSEWVGFENFIRFFSSIHFTRVLRNTFTISMLSIVFTFPLPIIFALMLNEVGGKKFKKTVQTISYMPHFISLVVICGMISDFCRTNGIFNDLRILLGAEERVALLSEKDYFYTIYIGSGIWQQLGWSSIIYLASLSSVDPNLCDAAYVDGAGRFQRIWHITLPCLVPVISIQLIMRMGNVLSVGFEKIVLLYNPLTYEKADVISSFVYRYGLQEANYSYGAAVGLFNSVINITCLVIVNRVVRKLTESSLW